MPGYSREILDVKVEDKYLCSSCLLVLREPCQIYCGHRYCKPCLDEIYRKGATTAPKCPIDKEALSSTWLENHLKICPLAEAECSFSSHGCSFKGKRTALHDHETASMRDHFQLVTRSLGSLELEHSRAKRELQEKNNETDLLKEEVKQHELDIKMMASQTDRQINLEQGLGSTGKKEEVDQQKRELSSVKEQVKRLDNRVNSLESRGGGASSRGDGFSDVVGTELNAHDRQLGIHDVRQHLRDHGTSFSSVTKLVEAALEEMERMEHSGTSQMGNRGGSTTSSGLQHESGSSPVLDLEGEEWMQISGASRMGKAHDSDTTTGDASSFEDSLNDRMCKMCMDDGINAVFIPCGHQVVSVGNYNFDCTMQMWGTFKCTDVTVAGIGS